MAMLTRQTDDEMAKPCRRRSGIRMVIAVTCLACCVGVPSLQAQPKSPPGHANGVRLEPWATIDVWPAPTDGNLVSSHTPSLPGFESTGDASQTLTIARKQRTGWAIGLDIFPSAYVGLQLGLSFVSHDLGGENGPYNVTLNYVAQQPPDYTPRQYVYQRSTSWPDTVGVARQRTLTINTAATTRRAGAIRGFASGGLAVVTVSGEGESLGYTAFRLGGHSVLFSEEYRLSFGYGPHTVAGWNAGGGIDVAIGPHASVLAGLRYQSAGRLQIPVQPVEILNPSAIIQPMAIESLAAEFGSPTLTLPSGDIRFSVGIRVRP